MYSHYFQRNINIIIIINFVSKYNWSIIRVSIFENINVINNIVIFARESDRFFFKSEYYLTF